MRRVIAILSVVTLVWAMPVLAQLVKPAEGKHAANTANPKFEKDDPTKIQKGFEARHKSFNERIKKGNVDLVFIGDSITQGWEGAGKEIWAKNYAPRNAVNLGIGGDRTEHVIWRLQNGNLDGVEPKVAVVMIGTNNSGGNAYTAQQIGEGVVEVVKTIQQKTPKTKVLILAIFPRGEKPNPQREKNAEASKVAEKLVDNKQVFFLDIGPKFLTDDGTLSKEIMPDLLHLSPKGYQIWADSIESKLKELLDEKS
jgi:lysophospholipase L1-like esterase